MPDLSTAILAALEQGEADVHEIRRRIRANRQPAKSDSLWAALFNAQPYYGQIHAELDKLADAGTVRRRGHLRDGLARIVWRRTGGEEE